MCHRLAAVVLNYNDSETTLRMIRQIEKYEILEKILVVDNCSTDDSFSVLSTINSSKVDVIKSEKNGGYGYGNNYGIKYLNSCFHPSHILIANPDIQVEESVLIKMLEVFAADKSIAVVAPYMLNRFGEKEPGTAWKIPSKYEYIFSAGLLCGHFLTMNKYVNLNEETKNKTVKVDCVAGSLLMVDTKLMIKYGMYDENIFLYGEETTLGCRFKREKLNSILLTDQHFIHLHVVSIHESHKSKIRRRKQLLNSRLYILNEYLGATSLDLLLAKIVFGVSMIEYRLLLTIS